jgi:hypothetical protein
MRRSLSPFVFLFVFVSSCSLVESIKATAATTEALAVKVGEVASAAGDTLAEAKTTYADAKAAADTDGDGETSANEWLLYLLSIVGITGGAVAEGRRRIGIRNVESDARKSLAEARLDALEARG